MLGNKYRILTFLLVLLFKTNILFAGTTGKIVGKITDGESGEPLFGVNVIVEGTTLGAATDIEGDFVILHVPPGVHTLKATMIGYAPVTVNEVRVRIDETTPVNFEMVPATITTGDIVVTSQRNVIKHDVSTSVSAVQPDEIEQLPVSSIDAIVGLQAGVEDGLVVRGGSADELLLQVDGLTLRDPRNNQPIASVPLSSIQEVSIERGGFNAEYGEVRSGIVNIVSKEGGKNKYHASFQMKYSPATPKHFGISVFDPMSMWNRPYVDPEVAWTGTQNGAWDIYTQRQYPEFEGWNSLSQALLEDDDPSNDLSPAAAQKVWQWERRRRPSIEPDYIADASFGGPVPFISEALGNLRFFASFRYEKEMLLIPLSRDDYREYTGSIKINSDLSKNIKLQITGTTGKNYNVVMNSTDRQFNDPTWGINGVQFWSPTDYLRDPYRIAEITNEQRASRIFTDSWYSTSEVNHYALAGKLTNFISNTTYFEVSLEHLNRDYLTGPIRERDTETLYEIVEGYFVDEAPFGFSTQPNTGLTGMFFGGHSGQIRDSSNLSSYSIKADLTSQVTKEHLIKAGIQFAYYNLDLNYGTIREFFGDYNFVKETWNPFRFSAYVQDKIEMLGFIANLGVRMDYSDPNTTWVDVEPFDPFFSSNYTEDQEYPETEVEPDISFSPRLGISHPVTENSKLYFNYGHFKQMPAYEEIFRVGRSTAGAMQNFGDPTLEQAKTISYELGYDHVLFDEYLVQIAAFYNDVSNQQAYTQYVSDRKSIGYFKANNNSYEDIRGLEVTLKKTAGGWIRGFANFTYQVSTQGAFGKQIINEDPGEQKLIDQNTVTLYQQKPVPEPRANASITFLTPSDFGPSLGGIDLLNDWSVNLLAEWRAGEHITYNPNNVREVINNVQVTDYYNFDLRINKSFDFNFFSVMFFMEIRNLLNTKRLSGAGFYDVHDQRYYMESLHLPESNAYNNIPGNDKIGDYRKEGVPYQPIENVGNVMEVTNPNTIAIYYDRAAGSYFEYVDENWVEVDNTKMEKILDDKAYIDMPNNTSFNFLNPRQIFFGIGLSFNL